MQLRTPFPLQQLDIVEEGVPFEVAHNLTIKALDHDPLNYIFVRGGSLRIVANAPEEIGNLVFVQGMKLQILLIVLILPLEAFTIARLGDHAPEDGIPNPMDCQVLLLERGMEEGLAQAEVVGILHK